MSQAGNGGMPSGERSDLITEDDWVDFFKEYCQDEVNELAKGYPREKRSLYFQMEDLHKSFNTRQYYRVIENPEKALEGAANSLSDHQRLAQINQKYVNVRPIPPSSDLDEATKTEDRELVKQIRDLRHEEPLSDLGKLVSLPGVAQKATDVRPKITEANFECMRCGSLTKVPTSGSFSEPNECAGCERDGPFEVNFAESTFIDQQVVHLQESPNSVEGGETPQEIKAVLNHDITGEVTAGDDITITGVFELEAPSDNSSNDTVFKKKLDGRSISFNDATYEDEEITKEEEEKFEEYADSHTPTEILNDMKGSIAPGIYGNPSEKRALAVVMFGGVRKVLPDGSKIRGDMHLLIMGDPGVGKSQMIAYLDDIVPKSVHASGKGTSAAGLTAAAVRDDSDGGGQWTLEAGALVLADQGVAITDELDKMKSEDQAAMHEAMEQQKISISKAGINATLRSQCSVVGAANPKDGRFDPYEPPATQIDLPPALISRFDLMFMMQDEPDEEADAKLADHMATTNQVGQMETNKRNPEKNFNFEDMEQVSPEEDKIEAEHDKEFLRKYVAYARQNYDPTLTEDAKEAIKDFYVDVRSGSGDDDTAIPVTARKLEALTRVCEGVARMCLSDFIETKHARKALEIVKDSLNDVGVDPETGELDANIVNSGTTKSQMDRKQGIKNIIKDMNEETDGIGVPVSDVTEKACNVGLVDDENVAEDEITNFYQSNEFFEPSPGEIAPM